MMGYLFLHFMLLVYAWGCVCFRLGCLGYCWLFCCSIRRVWWLRGVGVSALLGAICMICLCSGFLVLGFSGFELLFAVLWLVLGFMCFC